MAAQVVSPILRSQVLKGSRKGKVMVTVRTILLGDAQADEWIAAADLGLSWIDAIVGYVPIGATAFVGEPAFQLNAEGTGDTEGDTPGNLGLEASHANDNVMEVTVIGTAA